MALDANGNATIAGQYDVDMDADPGPGIFTLHNNGGNDAFLIHFDTNGNLSWAKSVGGNGTDYGDKVSADSYGNVIQVVQYQSSVAVGSQVFSKVGLGFNGLVIKYDLAGNLLWAINLSDSSGDAPAKYSWIDNNDNILISGGFSGIVNFNPLGTPYVLNGNGGATYVAKYSPSGTLLWVRSINGIVINNNVFLGVNSANDVYVGGPFSSTLSFGGSNNLNPVGPQDMFIARYDVNGVFQFDKDIGGSNASVYNYAIDAKQDDNIYISGYFNGTVDFDPSPTAKALIKDHGQRDVFLSKYDSDLNYKWAFSVGSANCNNSIGRSVVVDNNNDVLLAGSFCSTVNFDASGCTNYNLTAQSPTRDSFVGKYVQSQASATSQITAISVPQQSAPAVIDQTNLKITLTVPAGTDVSALVPNITVTSNTTLSPASGTAQNFNAPNTYTLTSNCTALNYTVTVVFAPVNTLSQCSGLSAALTGDATTQAPDSYLWQQLVNGSWIAATGTNNQANYTSDVLTNNGTTNATITYRRQTIIQGNTYYDSNYAITVLPQVYNNAITAPSPASFCLTGDPSAITGSLPNGGSGGYTYQWQSSVDNINFSDIAGATNTDYDPPVLNSTTYYRRVVLSGSCPAPSVSNVVTILIETPILDNSINTSSSVSFCAIAGTVPSGGNGTFTYQWQSSTDGVNFTNINGATSPEYNPPATNTTMYYRRIAISGSCVAPAASNIVSVLVQVTVANNTITSPTTTVFCANGAPGQITGSIPTGGNGSYNYQWQSSTDNINFTDITGATAMNYDPGTVTASTYYRRAVTSGVCITPLLSNVIFIQIQQALANNVITPPAVIVFCQSGNPAAITGSIPTGGDDVNYAYQWQLSTDGIAFSNISGATAQNYAPGAVTATMYYRRLTTSGTCTVPILSNVVNLQVQPALSNDVITPPAVVNFCTAMDPAIINGNTPNGGNGTYSYQWQSSADNIVFVDIAGATAQNYDPPLITATTYYRRIVVSGACTTPMASNLVTITRDIMPMPNAGADQTICVGGSTVLTATGGTTYQWAPATGLSNTNVANPTASPVINTVYTVTAYNGACSATATVTVNVVQKPTADAGADQKIVAGQSVQLSGAVTGSNVQYYWSPSIYLDNPHILNPRATPPADITYTLYATSANNCFIVSDDVFIKVFPKVIIPNTFTPNADGVNDTWNIDALNSYPGCIITVFNRYGTLVYKSTGYALPWDGNYNGSPVPSGTYYYTIDLKNGSKMLSGWVAVIR